MPRTDVQLGGGPYATGLDTADTTTSGTKWWLVHHQSFYGMYERRNIFDSQVSSNTVAAPAVVYNLLDASIKVTTTDELVYADFSGGNFNQYQDLVLVNNSTMGGFGSSGTITTSSIGIMRRPAILVGGQPAEASGTCTNTFNYQSDKVPGPYDLGGAYDTSSDSQPIVFDLIKTCKDNCKTFETFLVNI